MHAVFPSIVSCTISAVSAFNPTDNLKSCSVACSSAHKATHPASESPAVAASSAPPPPPPKQGSDSATSNRPRGPFAALEESTELQELFRMYPNLPSQLEAIYSATLPPTANNHTGESGNAGGTNNQINFGNWPGSKKKGQGGNRPWNQDIGLQSGVKALCKAREAYGKDGEAVREYSRLVLKILSRDDGLDAVEQIQKELAEENARLISQLLNGEM